MLSVAHRKYLATLQSARRLTSIATDKRLRPLSYHDSEPALHAALAAYVSAWEAYVENVVVEFVQKLQTALSPEGSAVATVLLAEAKRAKDKFNTPNFENSRNFVLRFTGVDVYSSMTSSKVGLSAAQTNVRLNEVLTVRHSFAHGFPIPNYGWLKRYGASNRLTKSNIQMVERLLNDLVKSVDNCLETQLKTVFATSGW